MIVRCDLSARNRAQVPCKDSQWLLTTELVITTLVPVIITLKVQRLSTLLAKVKGKSDM